MWKEEAKSADINVKLNCSVETEQNRMQIGVQSSWEAYRALPRDY